MSADTVEIGKKRGRPSHECCGVKVERQTLLLELSEEASRPLVDVSTIMFSLKRDWRHSVVPRATLPGSACMHKRCSHEKIKKVDPGDGSRNV